MRFPLSSGFRWFFLQNGANRVGTVLPSEWQMSAYIPLAYYLPGLVALAAFAGLRLRTWALGMAKPLGWGKLGRGDWFDKSMTLGERYFVRFPVSSVAVSLWALLVAGLVLWASVWWKTQGVEALSLGFGLACVGMFLLGGSGNGPEAFLWVLGGCFCFMVAGVEKWCVADRMNTIFKVWMNGWIIMGLVFGAGFAAAFDPVPAPRTRPMKKKGRRRRLSWIRTFPYTSAGPWLAAFGLVVLVVVAAFMDVGLLVTGWRFLVSYLVFGLLLLAVMGLCAFYGAKAGWWRWTRQGVFMGLLGLGLLYPLGAVVERIWEASQFRDPHLDGMRFMAQRESRFNSMDKDYDKHDYALITWLNRNATVTETLAEAPGLELYKGFNRYAIYTGLPTLLGWDYQVSQQLGERTGGILEQRKRDAAVIYGPDDAAAVALLKQYRVRWIVVGSLERKIYPQAGLDKFNHLATQVLVDGPAVLYRFDWDKQP